MLHRRLALASALVVLAPLAAVAEDNPVTTAPMTAAAAGKTPGTGACDAVVALPDGPDAGPRCKQVATKKIAGLGTAIVYSRHDGKSGMTRFVMVIEATDGSFHLGPPSDVMDQDCGAGKCETLKKVTPVLRAIKLDGKPAAVLDLDASMIHDFNEGDPPTHTPYHVRSFFACGMSAASAWTCASASFGNSSQACKVKLAADGELTFACDETATLSLGK